MFRLILVVLAAALYIDHHVIHRSPSVKRPALKLSLSNIELWLVLTASCWTLALVFYAAGFDWFNYTGPLPAWIRWTGVVAMVACAPLSRWTYHTLGVHFSKKLELREGHRLIRSGPYRFVRHPMYATLFLCAIATCLVSANYIVVGTVVAVAVVFLIRMKKEETMLIGRFGDEYRDYRRRTGALIPGLGAIL
jgi:protein-S-isoprenylcysteine O-methyltransferase Ste14